MRAGAIFIPILLAQGVVARAVRSRDLGGSRRNGTQRPGSGGRNGSPQAVAPGEGCSATGKAVYFLTNDDENSVVALTINGDGTLRKGSVTSAGGKGSISLDGATGEPAVNDGLVSQGSLTVAGQVSSSLATKSLAPLCLRTIRPNANTIAPLRRQCG